MCQGSMPHVVLCVLKWGEGTQIIANSTVFEYCSDAVVHCPQDRQSLLSSRTYSIRNPRVNSGAYIYVRNCVSIGHEVQPTGTCWYLL